jgi:hypothetical protein
MKTTENSSHKNCMKYATIEPPRQVVWKTQPVEASMLKVIESNSNSNRWFTVYTP